MTNKEINAAVKKELKAAGYNTKDFRVSVKDSLYDRVIRVTVKNPYISRAKIEGVLKHWESYEIDQRTAEILQGGNTYLFVEYASDIIDQIPEEEKEKALAILKSKPDGVQIAKNGENSLHAFSEDYRTRVIEFNGRSQQTIFTYNSADFVLALFRFWNLGTITA